MARIHRAAVESARQVAEKPALNASEGREIPCQPCRNSAIKPVRKRIKRYSGAEREVTIAYLAACDLWMTNYSTPGQCETFRGTGTDIGGKQQWATRGLRCPERPKIVSRDRVKKEDERYGQAGRQGCGDHRRDE